MVPGFCTLLGEPRAHCFGKFVSVWRLGVDWAGKGEGRGVKYCTESCVDMIFQDCLEDGGSSILGLGRFHG